MANIQVCFLFTSIKNLSPEEQDRVKNIVAEEYGAAGLGCNINEIEVSLLDAYSKGNKNDIIVAVEPKQSIMNAGTKRANVREKIANRFSLLSFMKRLGFSGKIEMRTELFDADPSPQKGQTGQGTQASEENVNDYHLRAKQYQADEPSYSFDMVQIPQSTIDRIERAVDRILLEREVFEEWGLYAIMPNPVAAMSFYGPPGTGKSMAADAIAHKMEKKIIRASYADIENKYVGEGPKNVSAIFIAAEEQDAILFIDEADSLLSKRMVNVTDPSGQAMNSMRSQLLISLEKFHGIVIFATNLAVNYDQAFVSRLINIEFTLPDAVMRTRIWEAHLRPQQETGRPQNHILRIPLADDVDTTQLGEKFEFCGRDIRSAVVDACVDARRRGMSCVDQATLLTASALIQETNRGMASAKDHTDSQIGIAEKHVSKELKEKIAKKINQDRTAGKEDGLSMLRQDDI